MSSAHRSLDASCAAVRADLDEPLYASAPELASSWLLVEHPGPWPSSGLPQDFPGPARDVLEAATEAGVRPQLIRRLVDRRRPAATVVLASCRPGRTWTERRTLTDLRALTDLDIPALADGTPPGFGTRASEPVVLVCTHGRRDVCCARLGRPLAVLLDAQLPGQVWETNHVGGDRFAPNVVALPDGTYHGGLSPTDVPELAEALAGGRVLLRRLRGRAGLPSAVQAADYFVREHLQEAAVHAVRPVSSAPFAAMGTCVELLVGTRWCVHVRTRPGTAARLTSCAGGGTVGTPDVYELVGLRRLT
ncbi:MAG: sucrase ferredoxin [Actinobacteria bacterium]|nr:sucrase ferredoxin [Actinomycetota bacterium]MBW3646154.1 sucrase ferredoxin [Actinomycetota bacterium]